MADYTITGMDPKYVVDPPWNTFDLTRPISFENLTGKKIRLTFRRKDGKADLHCFDGDTLDVDKYATNDTTGMGPSRATHTEGSVRAWTPDDQGEPHPFLQGFDINF